MIILKVYILIAMAEMYLHLNSNMIILKVEKSKLILEPISKFKFQYDNT